MFKDMKMNAFYYYIFCFRVIKIPVERLWTLRMEKKIVDFFFHLKEIEFWVNGVMANL